MRSIAATALVILASTASPNIRGVAATAQEPATPASTASSPAPQETSSGNLLASLYQFARGLGLARCLPYALPLVTTLPRLPAGLVNGDLVAQALSQTTLPLSGVCDFSITGAVGEAYTGFLPAWYSWQHAHAATIGEVLGRCPSASALVRTVEAYESCPQVASAKAAASLTSGAGGSGNGEATATATETETGVGTATSGGGDGSSDGEATDAPEITASASDAAMWKDTCLAVAPAAAVGLLGFVVAL